MNIVIVCDSFFPLCNSASVQIRDLSSELLAQGHFPTVVVPDNNVEDNYILENYNGVRVLRLKSCDIRGGGYVKRTLLEMIMPLLMLFSLRRSPLDREIVDAVVWYSPSIFFGLFVHYIKKKNHCKSYLILRDIFPQWAVDVGLLKKGLPYWFFKMAESYQYSIADVIGVQTPGNLAYLKRWSKGSTRKVEVLENWLADNLDVGCSIDIEKSPLAGRKIFVYAGNMGVAQGMEIMLALAESLLDKKDIGFVFVGRGTTVQQLKNKALSSRLDNVLFYDAIDPNEVPGLYSQCHVGLISLDTRHKTHNIPGKFLSYMFAGLPVLAVVNSDNDLMAIVNTRRVGCVWTDGPVAELKTIALQLIDDIEIDADYPNRCRELAKAMFSTSAAARKLVSSLS